MSPLDTTASGSRWSQGGEKNSGRGHLFSGRRPTDTTIAGAAAAATRMEDRDVVGGGSEEQSPRGSSTSSLSRLSTWGRRLAHPFSAHRRTSLSPSSSPEMRGERGVANETLPSIFNDAPPTAGATAVEPSPPQVQGVGEKKREDELAGRGRNSTHPQSSPSPRRGRDEKAEGGATIQREEKEHNAITATTARATSSDTRLPEEKYQEEEDGGVDKKRLSSPTDGRGGSNPPRSSSFPCHHAPSLSSSSHPIYHHGREHSSCSTSLQEDRLTMTTAAASPVGGGGGEPEHQEASTKEITKTRTTTTTTTTPAPPPPPPQRVEEQQKTPTRFRREVSAASDCSGTLMDGDMTDMGSPTATMLNIKLGLSVDDETE